MDSVLSLLGLIYKAKKMYLGENNLNNMSDVKYLFVASDASDKTKERYFKKCEFYSIPCNTTYTYEQLSKALGKGNVKVIGITDPGFTKTILNKLK